MTGLYVARHVVVEYPIEGESVINPNVHTHIIESVMEVIMKGRSVMNTAAQVC